MDNLARVDYFSKICSNNVTVHPRKCIKHKKKEKQDKKINTFF